MASCKGRNTQIHEKKSSYKGKKLGSVLEAAVVGSKKKVWCVFEEKMEALQIHFY